MLPKESFLEKPELLISYLRDMGFEKPIIRLIETIIELDRRRFLISLKCSNEDLKGLIHDISNDCFITEDIVFDIIQALRYSLDIKFKTMIVEHPIYGRCRCSLDRMIYFNEEMDKVIDSSEDVEIVDIPDCVKVISDYAFEYRRKLIDITIPDSVTEIGSEAFCGCTSLSTIVVPTSVRYIGYLAFSDCVSLHDVFLPNTVKIIKEGAFSNCENASFHIIKNGSNNQSRYIVRDNCILDAIDDQSGYYALLTGYGLIDKGKCVVPEDIKIIGQGAFEGSTSLHSVFIPNTVEEIEMNAFSDCKLLDIVKIQSPIINIDSYAFSNCISLQTIIIPNCVKTMGCNVFDRCVSLKRIKMPDGLTTIEDGMFSGCTSLEEVILPSHLKKILNESFMDCSSIESIDLPRTIQYIHPEAFFRCGSIYFNIESTGRSINRRYLTENGALFLLESNFENKTLMYGSALVNGGVCVVPNDVLIIRSSAFSGCHEIRELILPDSVIGIDKGTFSHHTSIWIAIVPKDLEVTDCFPKSTMMIRRPSPDNDDS